MILYNTLTRREETFTQPVDTPVRIYTCGLTVYTAVTSATSGRSWCSTCFAVRSGTTSD